MVKGGDDGEDVVRYNSDLSKDKKDIVQSESSRRFETKFADLKRNSNNCAAATKSVEASYLEHADQDGYKGHAIEGQSGDIDFGHGHGFVVNLIIECEEHEQTDDGQHQHEDAQKEACRIPKKKM